MEFEANIKQFANRVINLKEQIETEEATKTSLVMPFFNLLGYDIFNPSEFVPEFTADFGTKKGEKVDYAIFINGQPLILIEAKSCNEKILDKHGSQLFRYFTTTKSKFGILTNGIKYLFFTDLDEANKLDTKPFFIFDFENIKESKIKELQKFKKENFDIDNILNTAEELKYLNEINNALFNNFQNPNDNFVDFILSEIYSGRKTQYVKEKFTPLINKAVKQFKNELFNNMLAEAIDKSNNVEEDKSNNDVKTETEQNEVVTTLEEIESFGIVKTLLSDTIDPSRITYKDTLSYFGVLIDNNTRKWICRIYLKDNVKYIKLPDDNKNKIKYEIDNIQDIIKYKDELAKVVSYYE